ncbi:aldo/keto reductase [Salisediminibacterium selenitireducens]|uniref:Aldo/keto reductase n=1 Tax=Bacillus selenitireducens (strain ATCC 700615 / DSM 15326 / MLS10) TaxID=439292 RepID=D6XVG9_BACIE|nr:aldo/keto reductase [Salisediminibacterium selenitireducens]ADH99707.1 aldo/keto reductase [[Bacillus] selenitireducens MLS10]
MKRNQLGTSSLYVSEIGLGCMSFSDSYPDNERIIHEAIDQGVNFFDTADLYQLGMNEEHTGKALKGRRSDIILSSKGGNDWTKGDGTWSWRPEKAYLKQAIKDSLKRLNTDYLDLYQLHGGTIEDPFDEVVEAFQEMKQEGLIRAWGISSIRPNVIKRFAENTDIDSVMMQYSLLDRRPEEMMPLLEQHQISVIARGPVAKGLLSDGWKERHQEDGYLQYSKDELQEVLPRLEDEAGKMGMSLQHLALRYVLDHPQTATAVPGASSVKQATDNSAAANHQPLNDKKIGALKLITKEDKYENHRS